MCSSTSAAITTSNEASAKGNASRSARTVRASDPLGASPAAAMAANSASTCVSSSALRSTATTSAPRRYASNACRPNPQPRSSTCSPAWIGNRVKSTVSMSSLLLARGDGLAVDVGSGSGHRPPGVALLDPPPTGGPERLPAVWIVQQPRQREGEVRRVAGLDQLGAVADHLGQRARTGGDQRRLTGHRLDRRDREPLVERRHDGDLRGRE